jgi:hypothetical protein
VHGGELAELLKVEVDTLTRHQAALRYFSLRIFGTAWSQAMEWCIRRLVLPIVRIFTQDGFIITV